MALMTDRSHFPPPHVFQQWGTTKQFGSLEVLLRIASLPFSITARKEEKSGVNSTTSNRGGLRNMYLEGYVAHQGPGGWKDCRRRTRSDITGEKSYNNKQV